MDPSIYLYFFTTTGSRRNGLKGDPRNFKFEKNFRGGRNGGNEDDNNLRYIYIYIHKYFL